MTNKDFLARENLGNYIEISPTYKGTYKKFTAYDPKTETWHELEFETIEEAKQKNSHLQWFKEVH